MLHALSATGLTEVDNDPLHGVWKSIHKLWPSVHFFADDGIFNMYDKFVQLPFDS